MFEKIGAFRMDRMSGVVPFILKKLNIACLFGDCTCARQFMTHATRITTKHVFMRAVFSYKKYKSFARLPSCENRETALKMPFYAKFN